MSTVLVYSDDPAVRERVGVAVGRRPDPSLDPIDWLEADDGGALVTRVDEGGVDVCILDGEAAPEGGMGMSRQLKNEIADCPAMLLLVMRRDDRWLARWSMADGVVQHADRSGGAHRGARASCCASAAEAAAVPAAGDELARATRSAPAVSYPDPRRVPSWPALLTAADGRTAARRPRRRPGRWARSWTAPPPTPRWPGSSSPCAARARPPARSTAS